ncbi:MAG: DUF2065 domain-containing protein [Gammaproteobacteria bacterium]|nr:DUF2065 domain-containing protein [Gammaproteobacteria bacterium]
MSVLHILLVAVAVAVILEGILPFLSPRLFRRGVVTLLGVSDRGLRVAGLCAIVAGIAVLYTLRFIA